MQRAAKLPRRGLLQLLVREVDAELLEAVHLEAFEAKNIKNAANQGNVWHVPRESLSASLFMLR